jgi:hypothetical protein
MQIPSIYPDLSTSENFGQHFGRSSNHEPDPPTIGDPPTETATWNPVGIWFLSLFSIEQ